MWLECLSCFWDFCLHSSGFSFFIHAGHEFSEDTIQPSVLSYSPLLPPPLPLLIPQSGLWDEHHLNTNCRNELQGPQRNYRAEKGFISVIKLTYRSWLKIKWPQMNYLLFPFVYFWVFQFLNKVIHVKLFSIIQNSWSSKTDTLSVFTS